MARINIEDSIYMDTRFLNLIRICHSIDEAMGALVRAFSVAQQFWKRDKGLIPKEVWKIQMLNLKLIEVGLVIEKEHGFYVVGSEEQFAWLVQRVTSGQKGGIASGESRRSEINELDRSGAKRLVSGAKPLTLTLTHTLNTINISDFDFEYLYALYPKKVGKGEGIERLRPQITSQKEYDDFAKAVTNYKRYLGLKKHKDWLQAKQFDVFVGVKSKKNKPWHEWVNPDESLFSEQVPQQQVNWLTEAEIIFQACLAHGFSMDRVEPHIGEKRALLLRKSGGAFRLGQQPNNPFTVKDLAGKLKAAQEIINQQGEKNDQNVLG